MGSLSISGQLAMTSSCSSASVRFCAVIRRGLEESVSAATMFASIHQMVVRVSRGRGDVVVEVIALVGSCGVLPHRLPAYGVVRWLDRGQSASAIAVLRPLHSSMRCAPVTTRMAARAIGLAGLDPLGEPVNRSVEPTQTGLKTLARPHHVAGCSRPKVGQLRTEARPQLAELCAKPSLPIHWVMLLRAVEAGSESGF